MFMIVDYIIEISYGSLKKTLSEISKGEKKIIFRYIPFLGMMTILMNDYPQLKAAVIGTLGFLAIINRE